MYVRNTYMTGSVKALLVCTQISTHLRKCDNRNCFLSCYGNLDIM